RLCLAFLSDMQHKNDHFQKSWKEDFVYRVENKNVKRSNEMYYPRFIKVIINFFMTKDPSISKRNRVNWHFTRDDPMFTTIKVVSRNKDTQLYGVILPDELSNEAIKDSESYKEYYAIASGAEPPKTKESVKKKQAGSDKTKTPPTAKGKRLKTSAKAAKPAKQKQPAKTSKVKGLTVLSEVALTEVEQIKLATKRSLIQTHSSHASWLGADEGTGGKLGFPDVPTYKSDDEQISWKSSDEEDDDKVNDDNVDNESDDDQDDDQNDDDDLVHPKLSTFDMKERQDDEDKEEEWSDDEAYDDENQGTNVEGEELDEEETNEDDEANELYRDVNVNLEGRDTEMTDAPCTIIQTTQEIEDTHVIITLVNHEDVPVTTIVETPLSSSTTLPPPPIPFITHMQQTPVPTPVTVQSSSLQDLPNFGSLFGFDHRLKTLENDFSEFKQTNQFAAAVSSIPGIIDTYLANKMNEVKTVNEQLEAEVLTRSSNESKTSHVVAANLSELELKKILIDKMESNKRRDNEDKDEELSAGSNRGSKRRRTGKELESTSAPNEKTSKTIGKSTKGSKSHHKSADKSAQAEEPVHTTKDLEELAHQEFDTGFTEDQPVDETTQHHDWFQKPTKPPTPDHDWNKTLPAAHGPIQPWISSLARKEYTRDSFNELMDTPLDFSAFVINWLKVDTLTLELLAGPPFELMKGLKSLVELAYFLEEVYKATTDQLDWNNPKGQQYLHDLHKPLPLIPNS
ncbi:hypothetical protein Tco_0097808, partial [Tanacetum coccineum]